MSSLNTIRGMHDILPEEFIAFQHVVDTSYKIAKLYGFQAMSTPILEFVEIFSRTLGETSDVVSKEMYDFEDKSGNHIVLRPEFTASVMRSLLSNGLQDKLPLRWFSYGPLFRYERPQKLRQRQFHQINFELLGSSSPMCDVEIIRLGQNILDELGISNAIKLHINSLGDSESRLAYRSAIVEYFSDHVKDLSEDSKERLHKNPLRILDSKDEQDKALSINAPKMSGYYNSHSKDFFAAVCQGLESLGIKYVINSSIVRGLDYYSHTTFEFITEELGAQGTVLGGGRYDGLAKIMGGPDIPAVGFASGIERLMGLLNAKPSLPRPLIVISVEKDSNAKVSLLVDDLRKAGVATLTAFDMSVKKSMKIANSSNASHAIVIGMQEIHNGNFKLRNLDSGEEVTVSFNDSTISSICGIVL